MPKDSTPLNITWEMVAPFIIGKAVKVDGQYWRFVYDANDKVTVGLE